MVCFLKSGYIGNKAKSIITRLLIIIANGSKFAYELNFNFSDDRFMI